MDSSFVFSDSDGAEELPDLDFLIKRPAPRTAKVQNIRTPSLAALELGENSLFLKKSSQTPRDESPSPKKPKQRALKTLEHNSLLLSPVKDVGTPRSKQRRFQMSENYSENLDKSFETFLETSNTGSKTPQSKRKIKPSRLVAKRIEEWSQIMEDTEYFDLSPKLGKGKSNNKDTAIALDSPALQQSRPNSSYDDDHSAFLLYEPRAVSPRKAPPISIPGTPIKPTLLTSGPVSPSKSALIPPVPFSPEADEFWSQSATNEWHDQHSPERPLTSPRKPRRRRDSDPKSPTFSTPTKLSKKANNEAKKAALAEKKQFEAQREQIAIDFLAELDATITEGKISKMSQETGGIKVVWSKKLNSTAGMAHWRREGITVTESDGTIMKSYKHHASIELATKVIDDESRLINTLAHEFCHLANFMISEVKNNPHGKEFKEWAAKCTKAFGNRGVKVTTKHSYAIDYKYIWECTGCGIEFKRHSKSIDPLKQSCGTCRAKLIQTKPKPREGGADSEYRIFVKKNFQIVKREHEKESLGFIMGILAKQYREQKQMKDEALDSLAEKIAAINL